MNITLGLAFLAGLVSFVSPCVLPLVPAYISYMGGRVTQTVAAQVGGADVSVSPGGAVVMRASLVATRLSTLTHAIAFVFGFTLIFVLFGLFIITALNAVVLSDVIGRIGGTLVILFGLHFMGVLPNFFDWLRRHLTSAFALTVVILLAAAGAALLVWGFTGQLDVWNSRLWELQPWAPTVGLVLAGLLLVGLFLQGAFYEPQRFLLKIMDRIDALFYADTRQQMEAPGGSLWSSFLMGVVFSAGWTPCIGPVYGTILTVGAQTGDVAYAMPLLTAYSLGLGIPFLLSALLLDGAQGILRRLQRHMRAIKFVTGALLIFMGITIASGQLQTLSQNLSAQFTDLSVRVEECTIGWAEGQLPFNELGSCLNGQRPDVSAPL
jgi:cytochrome c-type biogenesis protein